MSQEVKVTIPEPEYRIIEFEENSIKGNALVNISLRAFEGKEIFRWHLSLQLIFDSTDEEGNPIGDKAEETTQLIQKITQKLTGDPSKPNGVFLARVNWNNSRELVWRVFDPQKAHDGLQELVAEVTGEEPFAYRIDHDQEWNFAMWFLNN